MEKSFEEELEFCERVISDLNRLDVESRKNFHKAIDRGDSEDGEYHLRTIYLHGVVISRNIVRAIYLLNDLSYEDSIPKIKNFIKAYRTNQIRSDYILDLLRENFGGL